MEEVVAIKVFHMRFGGPSQISRMMRELEVLSGLRLPSVPRVIGYGSCDDGRTFVATDFVNGLTVDEHCERGGPGGRSLDRQERTAVLASAAEAVQSLHELGVIHRDLKPSNIMIDGCGRVQLVDFGLAATIDADTNAEGTLTHPGSPIGTLAFMPPEQARGEGVLRRAAPPDGAKSTTGAGDSGTTCAGVSTRSDIYALGATGYRLLLAGGPTPHDLRGDEPEVRYRVAHQPAREPRSLDRSIPRSLAAVLAKATAFDPRDRYDSAGDFAADLRRWERGEAVEAGLPGPVVRVSRWCRAHVVLATALSTVVAVMFVALCVWSLISAVMLHDARRAQSVRFDTAQHRVFVESGLGQVVRDWTWDPALQSASRPLCEFVERAREYGGGRRLVTAIRVKDGQQEWDDQLCIWDPRDLSKPLWHTRGSSPHIEAPDLPLRPTDSYSPGYAAIDDYFPHLPGKEILTILCHHSEARCCFRVYSLDGEELFEAWNSGQPGQRVKWLGKAGLIVFSANSNAWWNRLNPQFKLCASNRLKYYPVGVFAVRPEVGENLGWLLHPLDASQPHRYAWMKFAHAPAGFGPMPDTLLLADARTPGDLGRTIEVQLVDSARADGGNIQWTVCPDGSVMESTVSDMFMGNWPGARGRFSLQNEPQKATWPAEPGSIAPEVSPERRR